MLKLIIIKIWGKIICLYIFYESLKHFSPRETKSKFFPLDLSRHLKFRQIKKWFAYNSTLIVYESMKKNKSNMNVSLNFKDTFN
jgi:hypothetical protein